MAYPDPRLLNLFLGSIEHFPIERRIFNAVMFTACINTALMLIQTAFSGLSKNATILGIAATSIFILIYGLGRKYKELNGLVWIYIVINYLFLLFDWYFVGGIYGVALQVSVVLAGIMPLVLMAKQIYLGAISLIAFYAILIVSAVLRYDSNAYHSMSLTYIIDKVIDIAFLSAGLAIMTFLVISSFRYQRDKLHTANGEIENLNKALEKRNNELEESLKEIKTLRGILPICASCKKILDDKGCWNQLEAYIHEHSEAKFTHGICPDCAKKLYPELNIEDELS